MIIAVDAMGGDHAPKEIVAGAVEAARSKIAEILLVGDKPVLEQELHKHHPVKAVEIVHAPQVIDMDEAPAVALRRKKDSSIMVACKLVKDGKASALVSAGSTGAQMAASLLAMGRFPGIQRPAIATVLPTLQGGKVMLDVGANVDCRPGNLVQFAQMGSIYAEKVLGMPSPRVGLLNIGTEEGKGNELTQATYPLLKALPINFIGNVEPREIPEGSVDVIVCDGFVGNALLKFGEGIAATFMGMLRQQFAKGILTRCAALMLRSGLMDIRKTLDYAEYGGAPLLGVKGVSIICHGSSKARAITNAVKAAVECVEKKLVDNIAETMDGGEESNDS